MSIAKPTTKPGEYFETLGVSETVRQHILSAALSRVSHLTCEHKKKVDKHIYFSNNDNRAVHKAEHKQE